MASITEGISEIINGALFGHFKQKTACIGLANRSGLYPLGVKSIHKLPDRIFRKILNNFNKSKGNISISSELWRFKKMEYIEKNNRDPETKLEKGIIKKCGDDWVNQVPTSSGLVGAHSDKKRNIDLVHRISLEKGEYTFYELKVRSDNPVFAAMEILIYGMLYCLARQCNEIKLPEDNELSKAKSIHLNVLAPRDFYSSYSNEGLLNISKEINKGLKFFLVEFTKNNPNLSIEMDFRFDQFRESFSGIEETEPNYVSLVAEIEPLPNA